MDDFKERLAKLKRSPAFSISGPAGSVAPAMLELVELLGLEVERFQWLHDMPIQRGPSYLCDGSCGGPSVIVDGFRRCAVGCAGRRGDMAAPFLEAVNKALDKIASLDVTLDKALDRAQVYQLEHDQAVTGCPGRVEVSRGSNTVVCNIEECGWNRILGVDDVKE